MSAYYCINNEHPISDVSKKIAFEENFFDYNEFVQMGINVLKRLENCFSLLKRTTNFISFVSLHDISQEKIQELMKQTIDLDLFNKLFPEINGFEDFRNLKMKEGIQSQINYWIDTYLDFLLKRDTNTTKEIKSYKKGKFDIEDEIVRIGSSCVPRIVSLIEEYGKKKQINCSKSMPYKERKAFLKTIPKEEHHKYNAFTVDAEITTALVRIIMNIGEADNDCVERLQKVLAYLYKQCKVDSLDNGTISINLSYIARTLHALRPDVYPKADVGSSDNKLLNYKDFGVDNHKFD